MTAGTLDVVGASASKRVALAQYLDPESEEQAAAAAIGWIKALRLMDVEGQPLRRRFTLRGDSLWWFAELYLHKTQVVASIHRTLIALDRLVLQESPRELHVAAGGRILRHVTPLFAAARGLRCSDRPPRSVALRVLRMDARARALTWAALASRVRARPRARMESGGVAAFVHRAFWRGGAAGKAESYVGPVLEALERRRPGGLRHVAVGPSANFRARRWWHALYRSPAALTQIEAFAPLSALGASRTIWRERHAVRRALWDSDDIRRHAVIGGCDCWDLIREELAGVALVQWPWSARAMDEAGAALDALRPSVAITYAEAGGWGRAIMLEARRRHIPSVGLQHGFIYRHWLNYLHGPDEMVPDPASPADRGFPYPTLTLLFDEYAAHHLRESGHFPAEALEVTGSPRLDALVEDARALDPGAVAAAREATGAGPGKALAVVFTKYREARHVLPALARAVAGMPEVVLAIKTHPAETPDAYAPLTAGAPNVCVLPADAPLAPLLRASRAVVTVNSTVALDAAVLDIPTLVIGLPSNLSPFVEAGAMAGVRAGGDIGPALRQILYDEQFRLQLGRARRAFLARYAIGADGRAAERSADAVLKLFNPVSGD